MEEGAGKLENMTPGELEEVRQKKDWRRELNGVGVEL